jgi:hypothetical protein
MNARAIFVLLLLGTCAMGSCKSPGGSGSEDPWFDIQTVVVVRDQFDLETIYPIAFIHVRGQFFQAVSGTVGSREYFDTVTGPQGDYRVDGPPTIQSATLRIVALKGGSAVFGSSRR